jgi:CubicO group peptidase (beta-lactamase class C family)
MLAVYRRVGLLCACLFAAVQCAADDPQLTKKVDKLFATYNKPSTPGCALGIIRDGQFLYKHAYGSANLELGVSLTTQSIFDMGSISKQFVAASVVLAAEQGYLSLDDDVRKYIPDLPDYGQKITIRQMLHHTSGLRDLGGLLDLSGRNNEDVHPFAELLDLVARQKALNFKPGDEFLYSNTNYFLLAEVIRQATRKPLSQFAAENIFKPLGMNHTGFHDDHSVVLPGRVAAYDPADGDAFRTDWSTNYDQVGAGGLMSSVDDLLLWDQNFYANKLGKGGLVQEMLVPGVLNNGETIGYAQGLGISAYRGLPVVEHGGSNFGYRTEFMRFPEQKFSVICVCNLRSIDPELLATQVADIYLAGSFRNQSQDAPLADNRRSLAGLYRNPVDHSVADVRVIPGGLQIRDKQMRQVGPNQFRSIFGRYESRFEAVGEGGMKMTFGHSYTTHPAFERFEPVKVSDGDLAQYAGNYVSDELQATYKFWIKDHTLMLTINWTELPPFFSPSLRDEFHAPDDTAIVFRRDAAGRISGCDIYTERVRKMSLNRKSGVDSSSTH